MGRVVFCTALPTPAHTDAEFRTTLQQILSRYTSEDYPVTGLVLVYRQSLLVLLEGDNNLLFAILRRIMMEMPLPAAEVKVTTFIMDVRERWFNALLSTFVNEVRTRSSLLGGSPTSMGAPKVVDDVGELVGTVRRVEDQLKEVGVFSRTFRSPDQCEKALKGATSLGVPLPSSRAIMGLTATKLAPDVGTFLDQFDLDYQRYRNLRDWGAPEDDPEVRRLARFYQDHLEEEKEQKRKNAQEPVESPLAKYYPRSRPSQ